MILLTTSRRPTRGIRTFCHDLTRSIPNIVRISRGKLSITEVAEKALENGADKVIIVDRWKGGPGKIRFFNVDSTGLNAVPPLIYVGGIRLQKTFRKAKVKLVRSLAVTLSSEKSNRTSKIAGFLSDFLCVPMLYMEEASVNCPAAMLVSSDSAQRIQVTFLLLPEKVEIGPRIIVSRVVWEI
ncbi:MAG: Brix domain-containing protein [Candidatus Bathyarchaeia archaeon]